MKLKQYHFIFLVLAMSGCVTPLQNGHKINEIVYLDANEPYLKNCTNLGEFQARPDSIFGGEIGNSSARLVALKTVKTALGTHFLEKDSYWLDGGVIGIGYRCKKAL